MQYNWLSKKENKNLVMFFAGWSFDGTPFKFLAAEETDVIIFYDYGEISSAPLNELRTEFKKYEKIELIAWSMGVFAAQILKDSLPQNISKKVAVNGTCLPVDNAYGIPQRTFELTLKFVESGLKGKFYKNVFNNDNEFERYTLNPVQRTLENRAEELEKLYEYIKTSGSNAEQICGEKFYDFAIVSKFDKIIPPKNQINFWKETGCDIIEAQTGHFPFYEFDSWNEIINADKSPKSKETI
ncbi:DUF452 family protein [bacterium]|nr:DUF452 family protein [bacterium]